MTKPENSPDSIKPDPIKFEDFWFDDGDIVLSATDGEVEFHFRVHRAILTIASPVLRDMFSTQPREDDISQVPLPYVLVEDLETLLGALYSHRTAQEITFDIALGILRLSHKYQIEGLQKTITERLLEDWPLRRDDYRARRKYLGLGFSWRERSATVLIETAQLCEVSELLPTAFYEVACAWGTRLSTTMGLLSSVNVIRVSVGRERAAQRLRALATGAEDLKMWNSSPSKTVFEHRTAFEACASRKYYCTDGFSVLRAKLGEGLLNGKFALPAVSAVTREDLGKTCGSCRDWYMAIVRNKKQEIWESIPADFDLPPVDAKLCSKSMRSTTRLYCTFDEWPISDTVVRISPIDFQS